jgi:hypothetical protein
MDQMLERLSKHSHFCYLDGYSGFSQIPVHKYDQEKSTFSCPFGTFAHRRMPFGFCNVIRLKYIYNFLCSMLVYTPFALYFVTLRGIFMHFPELTH